MILFAVLAIALGCAILWNALVSTPGPRNRNRIDASLYTRHEDQEWVDRDHSV